MARILGILGSVTPPGRSSHALDAAFDRARSRGHEADLVDLADLQLEFADARPLSDRQDDSAALIGRLAEAGAVILASPVYRASVTGSLKNLLDLVPVEALRGKTCGIVAVGASDHHYLGVDRHLRDILAWFGAVVAPTSVYLKSADFPDGVASEEAGAQLDALIDTVAVMAVRLGPSFAEAGPPPLAASPASKPKSG